MKTTKHKGQLYRSLQAMSIIPLLLLGVVITVFSYHSIKEAMHTEVHNELKNLADAVILTYDLLYPGDYHLEGNTSYELYKGETAITFDYSIIDRLKEETGTEITLFYEDTRILTTIHDAEGTRIIATGANPRVIQDVLQPGQDRFYTNATINDEVYFAYYTPLRNADTEIIGMVFVGRPSSEVDGAVAEAVFPIIILAICSMVVVGMISSVYTRSLIRTLQKIRSFLSKVSTGNLGAELDNSVLRRNDELSEMGYSALYMQRSLRNLIEQDTLTELNNRRFADKRLKHTQMQSTIHGTSFVVCIGDIDLFKSVNDTYGHECGDVVLKKVSQLLKNHMCGKGFVARWGGEEFLFVYDNMTITEAKEATDALLAQIRDLRITYDDQPLYITMTFGLAEGGVNTNIKELLQIADVRLYKGKTHGRNQVITG